jgi:hypothetical protein
VDWQSVRGSRSRVTAAPWRATVAWDSPVHAIAIAPPFDRPLRFGVLTPGVLRRISCLFYRLLIQDGWVICSEARTPFGNGESRRFAMGVGVKGGYQSWFAPEERTIQPRGCDQRGGSSTAICSGPINFRCRVGRAKRAPPRNTEKRWGIASLDPPYSFIQIQQLIGPGHLLGLLAETGARTNNTTFVFRPLRAASCSMVPHVTR